MKSDGMTIQMKLLERYFYMVLFKFKCFAKWRVRFVLNFHLGTFGSKRFNFHLSHWIFVCLLFAVVWIYQHCNLQLLDIARGWICYRSDGNTVSLFVSCTYVLCLWQVVPMLMQDQMGVIHMLFPSWLSSSWSDGKAVDW